MRIDVVSWSEPVLSGQSLRQHGDYIVVFRMNQDKSPLPPGDEKQVQNLFIAQTQVIISHKDLERPVSAPNHLRQLLLQHGFRCVGDNRMKVKVQERLTCRAGMILLCPLGCSRWT